MQRIVLNKKKGTIKVVNRKENITLKRPDYNLTLRQTGRRGPQGDPGEKGDIGHGIPTGGETDYVLQKASDADYDYKWMQPTFSDKTYTKSFIVASQVEVVHNLNKYPAVSIVDSAGDEVVGDVNHIDTSQLVLTFEAPFSGRVTCN